MSPYIFIGLVLGLSSSLHCIGMCGPIALAIPVDRTNKWRLIAGILKYNLGRVFIYSILGALIGMIGLTIQTFGIMQWISIVSGILLILFAWKKYIGKLFPSNLNHHLTGFISRNIGGVMKSKHALKLPLLGMLNGLLPCGMVYVALTNAVLTGTIAESSLAMLFFGIGTIPAMFSVGFFASRITSNVRQKINVLLPYFLTLIGLLIVLRGMNLGIPYLSPKIELVKKATHASTEQKSEQSTIQMDCCHAKKSCE